MIANAGAFSSQNCQKSLGDLGVKVQELRQEVEEVPGPEELPAELSRMLEALCQQHDRFGNI